MARCVAVLCVLVMCITWKDTMGKNTESLQHLQRELIDELVHLAFDKGNKALDEYTHTKEHVTKRNKEGGSSYSYRKYHSFKRQSKEAKQMEKYAIRSLAATKELMELTRMSLEDLQKNADVKEAWRQNMRRREKRQTEPGVEPCEDVPLCDSSALYRTVDGSCNNLNQPNAGRAHTPQTRFLGYNAYGDGFSTPRITAISGNPLPSPRVISNTLFKNSAKKGSLQDNKYSVMTMAWGQFLDHDITLTPVSSADDGSSFSCCEGSGFTECFPIDIPTTDPYFTSSCMEFVRSSAAVAACSPGAREQLNEITAFVDASMVYGSDTEKTATLREFIGGRLLTSPTGLPPAGAATDCVPGDSADNFCMMCGDVRANVVPSLGANHVVFIREHNRIAAELATVNPAWTDTTLFEETRKIISALIQQITYTEWLPEILDKNEMNKYNLDNNGRDIYNQSVDPSIKNEFAVAALRYGHSLITPVQAYLLQDYKTYTENRLEDVFLNPEMVTKDNGNKLPLLARWVTTNESMKSDRYLEKEIRDLLFLDSEGHSFDLGSLNLQRGRDHGIPSYNDYRSLCGLPWANDFSELTGHSKSVRKKLQSIYESVDDIDLYAGGLSENPTSSGAKVGPVFSCIIGRQFRDLMYGDRFWYRQRGAQGFTDEQLVEISEVTLAKVMCTNFNMDEIQRNVFETLSSKNFLQLCSSLPEMNFQAWKSEDGDGNIATSPPPLPSSSRTNRPPQPSSSGTNPPPQPSSPRPGPPPRPSRRPGRPRH